MKSAWRSEGCTRRSLVTGMRSISAKAARVRSLVLECVRTRTFLCLGCTCRKYWLLTMRNREPQGCTRQSLVLECVRTHVFEVLRYTIANIIVQSPICTCSQGCTRSKSYGWNANISTRAGSYKVITLLVGTSLSRLRENTWLVKCMRLRK